MEILYLLCRIVSCGPRAVAMGTHTWGGVFIHVVPSRLADKRSKLLTPNVGVKMVFIWIIARRGDASPYTPPQHHNFRLYPYVMLEIMRHC